MNKYKVLIITEDDKSLWLSLKAKNVLQVIDMLRVGYLNGKINIKSLLLDEVHDTNDSVKNDV